MTEARRVVIDGMSIAYDDTAGPGTPLVMCHGSSSSRRTFEHQLRGLARSFRVVALDLPGHGDSDRATEPDRAYVIPGYARVLVGFLRALRLERAVLVGWSTGGHVVLHAAAELPDALGMFVFGTPPVGKPPPLDRIYRNPEAVAAAFRAAPAEAEIRALIAMYFHRSVATSESEAFVGDFVRTDPRTRDALGASIARLDYEDELRLLERLRPPLALVHAANDAILDGRYLSELHLQGLWRGGVQVLPDAGHAAHWEDPETFNAMLSEFAEERARAAAP